MSSSLDRWKRCERPVLFWCSTWAASARQARSPGLRRRECRFCGVDPAREPRGDLLDEPQIAVGIVEGAERPVAGALGVGAGLARLDGERRAVPHVTHVDATVEESVMGRLDVGDDERALGRARRGRCEPQAERDRGRRARGCELDDAKPSIGATSSSSLQPSCW